MGFIIFYKQRFRIMISAAQKKEIQIQIRTLQERWDIKNANRLTNKHFLYEIY